MGQEKEQLQKDHGLRLLLFLYILGPIAYVSIFGVYKFTGGINIIGLLTFIAGAGLGVIRSRPRTSLIFRLLIYGSLAFVFASVIILVWHFQRVVPPDVEGFSWAPRAISIIAIGSTALDVWLGAHLVKRIGAASVQWKKLKQLSETERRRFFLGKIINAKARAMIIIPAVLIVLVPQVVIVGVPGHPAFLLVRIFAYVTIGYAYFLVVRRVERKARQANSSLQESG